MGVCCSYMNCSDPTLIKEKEEVSEKILYIINDEESQGWSNKPSKKSSLTEKSEIAQKKIFFCSDSPKSLKISAIKEPNEKLNYPKSYTSKQVSPSKIEEVESYEDDENQNDEKKSNKHEIDPLDPDLIQKIEKMITKAEFFKKKEASLFKSSSLCNDEISLEENDEKINGDDRVVNENLEKPLKESEILQETIQERNEFSSKREKQEEVSNPSKTYQSTNLTQKNNANYQSHNSNASNTILNETLTITATVKSEKKPNTIGVISETSLNVAGLASIKANGVNSAALPRKSLLKCKSIGRNEEKTKKNKKKVKFKDAKNNKNTSQKK